jgi:hypothetical protein
MFITENADVHRDLEMLTSLDIQTLDSKVDTLAAKESSSQQVTVSHLEKIQEGVHSVESLQHATHQTTLEISRSTNDIHETLLDVKASHASYQQATRLQAERLDATLVAIQRSLLYISTQGRPHPKRRRTTPKKFHQSTRNQQIECSKGGSIPELFSDLVQQTADPSPIPAQLNRLVDLAVTVQYRRGKAHFEALAIPDAEFEAADFEIKLRMVKYLQDLRLLLWLLCRKEYTCDISLWRATIPRSALLLEAGLVSSTALLTTLPVMQHQRGIKCNCQSCLRYLRAKLHKDFQNFEVLLGLLGVAPIALLCVEDLLWKLELSTFWRQNEKLQESSNSSESMDSITKWAYRAILRNLLGEAKMDLNTRHMKEMVNVLRKLQEIIMVSDMLQIGEGQFTWLVRKFLGDICYVPK